MAEREEREEEYKPPYEYTDYAGKRTPGLKGRFNPLQPVKDAAEEVKRREKILQGVISRGGRAGY